MNIRIANGETPATIDTLLYVYAYDEQGQLLGEYDSAGNAVTETVYLGAQPVAVLKGGRFAYNLRFPGQYYDSETGLHYNYFRDYDPVIGRYIQSDPIGLQAGVNTYAYVGNDPLSYIDPNGLDETKIINTTGGRSVWDGPTNGNWGGKCWSGGRYSCGGHPIGKKVPTDSGDICYMNHEAGPNVEAIEPAWQLVIRLWLKSFWLCRMTPLPPRNGTENDSLRYRNWAISWFK